MKMMNALLTMLQKTRLIKDCYDFQNYGPIEKA